MAKLFISHAHVDTLLVEKLVELMEFGVGINHLSVFCTSQLGRGVSPGEVFRDRIRAELLNSNIALAVITPFYFESKYCLCELGALWASTKPTIPIIFPPATPNDLSTVTSGLHAIDLSKQHALDDLRDKIVTAIPVRDTSTSEWNDQREKFLTYLPTCYRALDPKRREGEAFVEKNLGLIASGLMSYLRRDSRNKKVLPWLVVLDVDHQNIINMRHGTDVGNRILFLVAEAVQRESKESKMSIHSGRCGDDTFFSLVVGDAKTARTVAEAMLGRVRKIGSDLGVADLWVTASATYARYRVQQSHSDWLSCADQGLENAKHAGGNRVIAAPPKSDRERRWS